MSKSIKTLVSDIYQVIGRDVPLTEEQAKKLGAKLTDTMVRELATPKAKRSFSMSSFGTKCLRKLWYKENNPEAAEPLAPHTKLKLLIGHIIEDVVTAFVEPAGHTITGQQDTLEVNGLKGHRDAVIDGVLVDVKSANSRSFDKFKYHKLETDDPFGYVDQISLYLEGSKDDPKVEVKGQAAFLAVDKEMGHLVLDMYSKRVADYPGEIDRIREALSSDVPPPRGFDPVPVGASGNEGLCVECRYCEFKETCHANANNGSGLRKFIYSNGPVWLTKVIKEPNVPEAT